MEFVCFFLTHNTEKIMNFPYKLPLKIHFGKILEKMLVVPVGPSGTVVSGKLCVTLLCQFLPGILGPQRTLQNVFRHKFLERKTFQNVFRQKFWNVFRNVQDRPLGTENVLKRYFAIMIEPLQDIQLILSRLLFFQACITL